MVWCGYGTMRYSFLRKKAAEDIRCVQNQVWMGELGVESVCEILSQNHAFRKKRKEE